MKYWFYNHAADIHCSDSDAGTKRRSNKKRDDVLQLAKAARKRALHPYQVLIKVQAAELCKERDEYFPVYAAERQQEGKRPSLLNCLAIVASRKLKQLQETNPREYAHVEKITRDYNSGVITCIPTQRMRGSDGEDSDGTSIDNDQSHKNEKDAQKDHNEWLTQVERLVLSSSC